MELKHQKECSKMLKLDLEKLLLNIFLEDKFRNKEHTIASQLSMITIKSLMPSNIVRGNLIDYKRFKEEVKLLGYYKLDKENIFQIDLSREEYFNYKDKTIYSRILPIIAANQDYDIIEEEVIKNILYTTGNIDTLLEWIAISKYVFLRLEKDENILENLKEYIINISQIDFLEKYRAEYLYDLSKLDIKFEINFEKARVALISLFHGVDLGKFKYLKNILEVFDSRDEETVVGNIINNASIDKKIDIDIEIEDSYERIALYVLKLRKSRIDPEDLKIKEYILPDVFEFKEGEVFFHSLLNRSKVIKKEVKNKSLTSSIQTRSGMYLFKIDPFN